MLFYARIKWTENHREIGEASSLTCKCPTGCKENHFYSLPFGQAETAFTSPDIILLAQKLLDQQNWFHSFSDIWIPQKTSLAHQAS